MCSPLHGVHVTSRLLEARDRDQAADAYDVLGVAPETGAADVKKRYWRLSLLVHPDKCGHARAHDAFQAVSTAAKELQARLITLRLLVHVHGAFQAVSTAAMELQARLISSQARWRTCEFQPTACAVLCR